MADVIIRPRVLVGARDVSDHIRAVRTEQTIADVDTTTAAEAPTRQYAAGMIDGMVTIEWLPDANPINDFIATIGETVWLSLLPMPDKPFDADNPWISYKITPFTIPTHTNAVGQLSTIETSFKAVAAPYFHTAARVNTNAVFTPSNPISLLYSASFTADETITRAEASTAGQQQARGVGSAPWFNLNPLPDTGAGTNRAITSRLFFGVSAAWKNPKIKVALTSGSSTFTYNTEEQTDEQGRVLRFYSVPRSGGNQNEVELKVVKQVVPETDTRWRNSNRPRRAQVYAST